nr:RNA methyltransferase [Anaeroplasmataceae bacterium]
IFKLEEKKRKSKLERFQKIACEAAEQSLRNIVPNILDIKKLKEIDFSSYNQKIVCYEESAKAKENQFFRKIIAELHPKDTIAIVIGPEGGLTSEEVEDLKTKGFIAVGLGPRILRTETVASYVLSCISYEVELGK